MTMAEINLHYILNNRSTKIRGEKFSKSTIKTLLCSSVFIVNFEQVNSVWEKSLNPLTFIFFVLQSQRVKNDVLRIIDSNNKARIFEK